MQQNYIPRKVFCISVKSLIPQCQFDFNSNLGHATVKSSLPPKTMRHIVSIIFLFIKTLILERKKLQLYKMKPFGTWQFGKIVVLINLIIQKLNFYKLLCFSFSGKMRGILNQKNPDRVTYFSE